MIEAQRCAGCHEIKSLNQFETIKTGYTWGFEFVGQEKKWVFIEMFGELCRECISRIDLNN